MARLLGLRLLKLDAIVTLTPAEVTAPSSIARDRPARAITPRRRLPAARPRAAGNGLARAQRTIGEGEQLLEQARRDGGRP